MNIVNGIIEYTYYQLRKIFLVENRLTKKDLYIRKKLSIDLSKKNQLTSFYCGYRQLIKSILANSAMIEGWANYTEIMMIEEVNGNSLEMWLMFYKWQLRMVTNVILDYGYHANKLG